MRSESDSPDGRFQVRVEMWEARASLWVCSPRIHDGRQAKIILRFHSDDWSLDESAWQSNTIVALTLRKFPGNHKPTDLVARVDCVDLTAVVSSLPAVPLAELEALLERQLIWN